MKKFNKELNETKILDHLKENGVNIPNKVFSVQINQKQRIENILGDNKVSDLIILLISYGLIEISENIGNNFEREKEIKILDVKHKQVEEKLSDLGAKINFKGKIIDTYFDTIDNDLKNGTTNNQNKSSIRIRYKVNKGDKSGKYYCTIKRRDKESNESLLRDCYEEEFEIFNPIIFYELLKKIGLEKYKMKVKNRVGYSLDSEKIKFDFDDYYKFPELLEIEAENSETAMKFIEELGLSKKETLNGGSGSLFKHYGLKMKKYF